MALPTTGITTTMVSQAIGLASGNVGNLSSRASVGGTSGYAFETANNGGTSGIMIDGAKPYFNIFSTNAPGYWYKTGSFIKYRLKNSGPDQSKLYGFSLGNFRGYDHAAIPLSWNIGASWYQAENKVRFNGMVISGDYNWSLVMSEQYGIIPAVNVYNSTGLTKLGTFYAGEAYSVNVDEYYFYGELDASQALSYVFRVGFVTLRADGTPGTTAYTFQKSGWFNPEGVSQAAVIKPTDVATVVSFGIDTQFYVEMADLSERAYIDPSNAHSTRISISFKWFEYLSVPEQDRLRTIQVTANNSITGELLYKNENYGTHLLRSSNTINISIPVYYTEMNKSFGVVLV